MARKNVSTLVMLLSFCGCSQNGFQSFNPVNADADVSSPAAASEASGDAQACLQDQTDYTLETHVIAFEAVDGGGVSVGFNLANGFLAAIGINLKAAISRLTTSMEIYDTLGGPNALASATGKGSYNNIDFGVDFDIYKINLDANYYYTTPVSSLTQKTLQNNLVSLNQKLKTIPRAWSSRITKLISDSEFLIPVGSEVASRWAINSRFTAPSTSGRAHPARVRFF